MQPGTLTFFAGKMGSGKSTLSVKITQETNAILISEDEWLALLYPDQIHSFADFLKYSAILKPLIRNHVTAILQTGVDVVLDFPANTVTQRNWFRELLNDANASGQLIYLKASDETCMQRLAKRRKEQPQRAAFDTVQVFMKVSEYFQEPDASEGLQIRVVDCDA